MVMALPLAGALAGAGIGASMGVASIGMSIGMMVGSWAMSALSKDKNQIMDPGAQELPRPNSAVRGSTLPILFGTNRVPSQIVWQDNFVTIRKESNSGGGGKFGGSAMGAKGGPATTDVAYTYKVDLIYHLGMSDTPLSLLSGWLGSDRLNTSTIAAITFNTGIEQIVWQAPTERDTATLQFAEGVFFPGNHPEETDWPWLTSQIDHPIRWPKTSWIGFRGMNLGASPTIPQIHWEVGQGGVDMNYNASYISDISAPGNYRVIGNGTIGKSGNNGDEVTDKNYVVLSEDVLQDPVLLCIEDGTIEEFSNIRVLNDTNGLTDWVDMSTPGAGGFITLNFGVTGAPTGGMGINGSDRYFLIMQATTSGQDGTVFAMYEVDENGDAQLAGRYFCGGTSLQTWIIQCGISQSQTEDDPILLITRSLGVGAEDLIWVLPSITQFKMNWAQTDSNRCDEIQTSLEAIFDNDDFTQYYTYYSSADGRPARGWFLPSGSLGTRYYFMVPKSSAQFYIDNPGGGNAYIDSEAPNYPDGFIVYLDLGPIIFPPDDVSFTLTGPSVVRHIANDDVALFPFDDACLLADGVTEDLQSDYYETPSVTKLEGFSQIPIWLIIFTKTFANVIDKAPIGSRGRARAYLYNSLDGSYTPYGKITGGLFDTVADMGATTNDRYNFSTQYNYTMYIPLKEELINVQRTGNSTEGALDERAITSNFGDLNINGGDDVYPPYIIRQVLVNEFFGVFPGRDEMIDEVSYQAALDYCELEDFKVSTQYRREENWQDIVELLLGTYGGYLTYASGLFKFGFSAPSTADFGGEPVRTIDNDHLLSDDGEPPVQVAAGALQDTYNKIRVNYLDRSIQYNQNFVEENDEVDQDLNGVRFKEFPPQFVMSGRMARKIALRTLWTNLYARDTYSFKLGPKDQDLEPGDVITLVDSFHPQLSSGQRARITHWMERERMKFDVVAIQEIDQYMTAVASFTLPTDISSRNLIGPLQPPKYQTAYELPQEFSTSPQLYVAWVPGAHTYGARLYASPDGVTFTAVANAQPYPIAGQIINDLPNNDLVQEGISVRLFPVTSFDVSTPQFDIQETLNEVTIDAMHAGAGLMWVGSEMLAYEGVTLVSQNQYRFNHVYRGWGGTNIQQHSSGDFFIRPYGGIFNQEYNEDKIGTTFHYKVVPYTITGAEYEVSSIEADAYTIVGRYFRPQNPSALQFVNSAGEQQRGLTKFNVGSTVDVTVAWKDTARQSGYGTGGYGIGGYGRFQTDTLSHAWRVEVIGSGDLVVRSTVVSTTIFTYPQSTNVADNGAFDFTPAFRVTPFGAYGDSIRNSIINLEIW